VKISSRPSAVFHYLGRMPLYKVTSRLLSLGSIVSVGSIGGVIFIAPLISEARDIEYRNREVDVFVTPGEPTQINFPATISGGFKKKGSSISLDRRQSDLVVFARDGITSDGEAIIVRLQDGRSYSLRIRRAAADVPRDDVVKIEDLKGTPLKADEEEEDPQYEDRRFSYAPSNQVSGLMREMVLLAEFGKASIPGYRVSEKHQGQTILSDGTMNAKIEKIFIGASLWGYVIDAENVLDQSQKVNPATFRIDGTRAISITNWELAPRPATVEEQIAGRHKTKVYIVARTR
jgi:TraK protein